MYNRVVGGPMDGTRWDVKVKPDSFFSFSKEDTLVFDKGRLSVVGDHSETFGSADYSAETLNMSGDDAVWHASLGDSEGGVMAWHGLVRGDTIEGVAVQWPREGKPRRFTFKGSRRA